MTQTLLFSDFLTKVMSKKYGSGVQISLREKCI